jgi:hypothetical protein
MNYGEQFEQAGLSDEAGSEAMTTHKQLTQAIRDELDRHSYGQSGGNRRCPCGHQQHRSEFDNSHIAQAIAALVEKERDGN